MKFSEKWLREWVDPPLGTPALVDQLTMAGLEVESFDPVAAELTDVMVALVTATEPLGDKLSLCRVDAGDGGPLRIVCGAPNARPGIKAPLVRVGGRLGDAAIERREFRGVESEGMLCSAAELGLGDDGSGIMELPDDAPVGVDLIEYLELEDCTIDLDLTPNRSDCLSVRGLAREVGVLNNLDVSVPEIGAVPATIDDVFPIQLGDPAACPRYVGRIIRNIDVNARTPLWLVERLRRCDVRSIDPVVDVTNYVMLELGQPMHAFDYDRLHQSIGVRMSRPEESIELLDGQTVSLREGSLLITDASGPIAIAGVMGGKRTAVSAETSHILLESAFFSPAAMAGTARSYGLSTDASHRFERGVDFELQRDAAERATALLLEITGGEPGPVFEGVAEDRLPRAAEVPLRSTRVERVLGVDIADDQIDEALTRLGLDHRRRDDGDGGVAWDVTAPSHRFDVKVEVDLIEEIARIFGYNKLPTTQPKSFLRMSPNPEAELGVPEIRRHLVSRGYQEAITYSFVDGALESLLDPAEEPIPLANPLSSDMDVMRTSLLPGLLKALIYNQNRQQSRIRLFEVGLRFKQPPNRGGELNLDDITQESMLGAVACGPRFPEGWANRSEPMDFFDVKGDLESTLGLGGCGHEYVFEKGWHSALHPGQNATISRNGALVGHIGLLSPVVQAELGARDPVYVFEISLQSLVRGRLPVFSDLSRFPHSRRDIAIVVDAVVPANTIRQIVAESAGDWLQNLKLFDVYQGKGIDPNRKSVALGLTFQHPSRNLTDVEVNDAVDRIVRSLSERLGATLRN